MMSANVRIGMLESRDSCSKYGYRWLPLYRAIGTVTVFDEDWQIIQYMQTGLYEHSMLCYMNLPSLW